MRVAKSAVGAVQVGRLARIKERREKSCQRRRGEREPVNEADDASNACDHA